jgi:hypothetical protein
MGEMRNTYNILIGKPVVKKTLGEDLGVVGRLILE